MTERTKKTSTRLTIMSCTFVASLAILILGCGGGGGGGGSTASTSATTSTTSTTSTTAGLTAGGGTGTTSGVLNPNVILFSDSLDSGATYNLYQVNPNGSSQTTLATLSSTNYRSLAVNPAVVNQKVFGYTTGTGVSPLYGIYKNNLISINGAVKVVAPIYTDIAQIQVSIDGVWIYYLASTSASGNYELFKVASSGGTPVVLDSDDVFSFSVDTLNGSEVVYDKQYAYSNGKSPYSVLIRPTALSGKATLLTNDNTNDYDTPQFSKDGTQIILVSDKDNTNWDVYTMSATTVSTNGSGLTRVTNSAINKLAGVTFSADGTKAAFVGMDLTNNVATGVYVTGTIGVGTSSSLVFTDLSIVPGIYWTSSIGRSLTGPTGYFARYHRRH